MYHDSHSIMNVTTDNVYILLKKAGNSMEY